MGKRVSTFDAGWVAEPQNDGPRWYVGRITAPDGQQFACGYGHRHRTSDKARRCAEAEMGRLVRGEGAKEPW